MRHSTHTNGSISLENLLRRRRSSLKEFVTNSGVTTYEFLLERCERMGVAPPSRHTFESIVPPVVNSSPTEGVIVLESPPLISESTGEEIDFPEPNPETYGLRQNKKRRNK